ncbi:MAG: hypothetical protein DME24_15350 [Verrucomicrobia bacterium]|nr:MAG: hypothetical protein DME24_15350 [Verrucomicrobiota bacterium]
MLQAQSCISARTPANSIAANTSDSSTPAGWTDFTVPTGTDKRIRSGAALDPNNPLGPTVYFHCNNGSLYALDANTGALRWSAATGNAGGPPVDATWDTQPVSSSPVVDSSGVVYVGSADGSVYAFNPSTGAQIWRVVLNSAAVEPVEATIAIGQNGILYVGTRVHPVTLIGGAMYAINPVTHTKVWSQVVGGNAGYVASPVLDQAGFIYAPHFDKTVRKLNPADGTTVQTWSDLGGKLCQTPSINQNGLLIIGTSAFPGHLEVNEVAAIKISDPNSSVPYWELTQVGGLDLGNTLGSPAIICTSSGTTYVADMLGKVFRFDSGGTMMAAGWPTFQCGNRRAGKSITYPSAIAELPPFTTGDSAYTAVSRLDVFGRAVGQSYGYYDGPCGYQDNGYAAALWVNNGISVPGGCSASYYLGNTYATALSGAGDVVGYYSTRAIVWPDGANSSTFFTDLTPPSGFTSSIAMDINSSGTIVGYGNTASATDVVKWTKSGNAWNTGVDFGTTPGNWTVPTSISDGGHLAGRAKFVSGGQPHAFLFDPLNGIFNDLGTFGGSQSWGWQVNDASGTVGWAQTTQGYHRAFLIPIDCTTLNGHPEYEVPALPGVSRLDWYSEAYGVNGLNQAVGRAQNQSLAYRAFLYKPGNGGVIDLNTITLDGGQTPASLGWTLTQAQAINDGGVIVGYGSISGRNTAWIIYPKCQD